MCVRVLVSVYVPQRPRRGVIDHAAYGHKIKRHRLKVKGCKVTRLKVTGSWSRGRPITYNQENYVFRLHDTGTLNNVIKWVRRCIDGTGA